MRFANGTERQTDWNAINWRKANRTVRNLRHRIFRAAQEGNLKRVRSLQKLMLKSYSNRLISVRRVTQMNAGKNTPGVVLSELKQHPGTVVLFLLCLSYKQPDYMGDID